MKAAWSNRNKIRFPLSIDAAACPVWKNISFNLTSESNFYGHWKMFLSTIGFLGFLGQDRLLIPPTKPHVFEVFIAYRILKERERGNKIFKTHSTLKNWGVRGFYRVISLNNRWAMKIFIQMDFMWDEHAALAQNSLPNYYPAEYGGLVRAGNKSDSIQELYHGYSLTNTKRESAW